jgi:hypothetical protein
MPAPRENEPLAPLAPHRRQTIGVANARWRFAAAIIFAVLIVAASLALADAVM